MKPHLYCCALLAGVLTIAGAAEADEYTIESAHTYPSFETSHMGISLWRGKFNATTGKISLDRKARSGDVEIAIDPQSINFGHDKMNEHARGKDFFNVAEFPAITYVGKIRFSKDVPAEVVGDLTLLGVTKPVKLKINSFKCIMHPYYQKEVCGADASGQFDRVDFGMSYGAQYGPTMVTLAIQVEAIRN